MREKQTEREIHRDRETERRIMTTDSLLTGRAAPSEGGDGVQALPACATGLGDNVHQHRLLHGVAGVHQRRAQNVHGYQRLARQQLFAILHSHHGDPPPPPPQQKKGKKKERRKENE